jgi:hypothetical protein
MGTRNQVGIGLPYRPARLHRLAELIPWNRFFGSFKVKKFGLRVLSLSLQSSVLGLPHPLTRRQVCSPLLWLRGGTHSLAGERVGESQFQRGGSHLGILGIRYLYYVALLIG